MLAFKVKLAKGGRFVVPRRIRKALQMEVGDELLLQIENQQLRIYKLEHAVREAQQLMAKYNPKKILLSEQIIEDRRNEEK